MTVDLHAIERRVLLEKIADLEARAPTMNVQLTGLSKEEKAKIMGLCISVRGRRDTRGLLHQVHEVERIIGVRK